MVIHACILQRYSHKMLSRRISKRITPIVMDAPSVMAFKNRYNKFTVIWALEAMRKQANQLRLGIGEGANVIFKRVSHTIR